MALIQIRDVPEDVYETIRRRARHSGQSIQAYMLNRIVEMGRRPRPSEVLGDLEADLQARRPLTVDVESLLADRDTGH